MTTVAYDRYRSITPKPLAPLPGGPVTGTPQVGAPRPKGSAPQPMPGQMPVGTVAPKPGTSAVGGAAGAAPPPPGTAYNVRSVGGAPPPPMIEPPNPGGLVGSGPQSPPPTYYGQAPSPAASRPLPGPTAGRPPANPGGTGDGYLQEPRPVRPTGPGRITPAGNAGTTPANLPGSSGGSTPAPPPPPPGGTTGGIEPTRPPYQRPTTPTTITEPPPPIDTGAPEFDENLRGDVYLPGEDERLAAAQGRTAGAMDRIAGQGSYSDRLSGNVDRYRGIYGSGAVSPGALDTDVAGGPDVAAAEGERASRYAGAQDAALEGLGGPSRTELAKQALADFEQQGEQGLAQRFRKVGQSAAKFGRMGMGDVNAELGSIQGDYERDLMSKRNELARDVSEGDIGDRFRRVDATSGLRRGEAGIDAGLRDESRTERDYDTGLDERNVGRRFEDRGFTTGVSERNQDRSFDRSRAAVGDAEAETMRGSDDLYRELDASGDLEDRVFGQGQQNRNEYRDERDRQDRVSQVSLDNRIRERQLGNQEREQRIARAIALQQAGGRVPNLDQLLA